MKEAASNMAYVAHECLSIPEVQKCLHGDLSLKSKCVNSVKHHHVLMFVPKEVQHMDAAIGCPSREERAGRVKEQERIACVKGVGR